MHQSDTGRIHDDHYPANTREVRVGYGYPVSGYPLQFLHALCLYVERLGLSAHACSLWNVSGSRLMHARFNFLVPVRGMSSHACFMNMLRANRPSRQPQSIRPFVWTTRRPPVTTRPRSTDSRRQTQTPHPHGRS
jgi:hypothetical protein